MGDLSEEDMLKLKSLLQHQATLSKVAKKEEAWTVVASSIKMVALWVIATLTATALLWDKIIKVLKAMVAS